MSVASRMGISKLAARSAEDRVALTSHGRAVAVVESVARRDEDVRLMRESAAAVLDAAADIVSARGQLLSLDVTCSRLGVDVEKVREKATEMRDG